MSEFQSRILYTQSSVMQHDEEFVSVSSTIYAIRFLYPAATQHTTSRIRITCTYKNEGQFESHAGIIERWSDKGWIFVDDYTGDVYLFSSEANFRKRLLDYAHCFIMGVPLSVIDQDYVQGVNSSVSQKPRKIKPERIFENEQKNKKYNNKKKKEDESKKDDDDSDDDSDDFYL